MESYSACITVNQKHSFSLPAECAGQSERRHFHTETQRRAVSIHRKERFLIKCILIFSMLIATLCVTRLIVKASDKAGIPAQSKYYTSITVQDHDTLWDLAQQYNPGDISRTVFINEIKQMNNMTSDTIYSGQSLLIYYYSDIKK